MSRFVVSAAALCAAAMFAITPAHAADRPGEGIRGGTQAGELEVSDHRRRYRHRHRYVRRYYAPRRYYGYVPYYAYPRPYYYRPYHYRRPGVYFHFGF